MKLLSVCLCLSVCVCVWMLTRVAQIITAAQTCNLACTTLVSNRKPGHADPLYLSKFFSLKRVAFIYFIYYEIVHEVQEQTERNKEKSNTYNFNLMSSLHDSCIQSYKVSFLVACSHRRRGRHNQFQWLMSCLETQFPMCNCKVSDVKIQPVAQLDLWYTGPVPPRSNFIQILDLARPGPLQATDETAYKHWLSCQRSVNRSLDSLVKCISLSIFSLRHCVDVTKNH